ncbi:MAG: hypothetical protein ACYTF6_00105 [Planctomycetota bacterium]|jgi:hypothetical protein
MANEIVERAIVQAVNQAYDEWAVEHPSLAAVIDHISLTNTAVESLRESPEYEAAVNAYHQSHNELRLLERLTELALPVIRSVLGI